MAHWIKSLFGGADTSTGEGAREELSPAALAAYAEGDLDRAESLCRQAISANAGDAAMIALVAEIAFDRGNYPSAVEGFRAAVAVNGSEPDHHYKLGCALQARGELAPAAEAYREALRLDPSRAKAWNNLGLINEVLENLEEAQRCLDRAVSCDPGLPQARHNRGNVLRRQGRWEEALEAYRHALTLDPGNAAWHDNLGDVLRRLGRPEEAEESYHEAVSLDSDLVDAHCSLGDLALERGDVDEALAHYGNALRAAPDSVSALFRMSVASLESRMLEQAEACARKALERDPRHLDACIALGDALLHQGKDVPALEAYERAMQLDPASPHALNNVGAIYEEHGLLDKAMEMYLELQRRDPQAVASYVNIGNILNRKGRLTEAEQSYRRALEIKPDLALVHSNLLLVMHYTKGDDAKTMFEEHRRFGARYADKTSAKLDNDRSAERRLRVGYVSPDFRRHSVAYFIEPVVEHHDRDRFEVICYSDVERPDEVTGRFRELADRWNNISRLSVDEAADVIREDGIDILVDLCGHTSRNRMPMFGRRLAPVQVTYLGYPNTTGLDTMDYRLTDAIADPQGVSDRFHSETLVRLPRGFLCYWPSADAPDPGEPPGMSRGYVTFVSFNNLAKLAGQTIAMWARVLQAVPGSRLLLKSLGLGSADAQVDLIAKLQERGVDPERVRVQGMVPSFLEHLGLYREADIALDVFPYNGTTTTCEALWMGVPVVTRAGGTHVSRVGASILHRVGLDDLVTESEDAFVQRAVALAGDLPALRELRGQLRERLRASSLCDAPGFTRGLEGAYREMWRRWCSP